MTGSAKQSRLRRSGFDASHRPGLTDREIFPVIASASEAIHLAARQVWIASSLSLLAMTNSTRLISGRANQAVGWVERSDTHHVSETAGDGFRRGLNPSCASADLPRRGKSVGSQNLSSRRGGRRKGLATNFRISELFACQRTQISSLICVSCPERGALRERHETRGGMRWTRLAPEDEGAFRVRPSRVVLTPRCWRQVCEKKRRRRCQTSLVTGESTK